MQLQDNEQLNTVIQGAPIGICIIDALTFKAELLNDKFLEIAGKPKAAIIGKWYWEPFAEVRELYEEPLNNVGRTGEPYYADEARMTLIRNGREETITVTFVYAPVTDATGKISKLAVWVLENTRQVAERKKQEVIKITFQKERDRLKSIFMQAPVGICILQGPELAYELVNPIYQSILPGRELLSRPIMEALPELKGRRSNKCCSRHTTRVSSM